MTLHTHGESALVYRSAAVLSSALLGCTNLSVHSGYVAMSIHWINRLTSAFHTASTWRPKPRRRASRVETTQVLESRQLLSAVVELVQDLNTEPASGLSFARPDRELFPIGDTLYFVGQTTLHGQELWKSDGTDSSSLRLTDINPGPWSTSIEDFENVDGVLYFVASAAYGVPHNNCRLDQLRS